MEFSGLASDALNGLTNGEVLRMLFRLTLVSFVRPLSLRTFRLLRLFGLLLGLSVTLSRSLAFVPLLSLSFEWPNRLAVRLHKLAEKDDAEPV